MSIVAYYIDVDANQLQILKDKPALVWNIRSDPRFAKASMVDLDEWQAVAWLASPVKRIETCHQAVWHVASETKAGKAANREQFKGLAAKSVLQFGCPPEAKHADHLLTAIEGRGKPAQRVPALDFGLGGARLFSPAEVKQIAVSFSAFKLADFRTSFNREEMARHNVGGNDWLDEPDSVRDEFLAPAFTRVSDFYQRAAKMNHHVLVIYQ